MMTFLHVIGIIIGVMFLANIILYISSLCILIFENKKYITNNAFLSLREIAYKNLQNDLTYLWDIFIERYLIVYINSKSIPNEQDFEKFKGSFKEMFYLTYGEDILNLYKSIFGGKAYFDNYLENYFQKAFKNVFSAFIVGEMLEKSMNKK